MGQILLLFGSTDTAVWTERTRELRKEYDGLCGEYLRYFTHPEELNKITADPLDDDPKVFPDANHIPVWAR